MRKPKFQLFEKVGLSSECKRYNKELKCNVPLPDDELDVVYQVVGMFVRCHYQFNDWEYLLYKDGWEKMGEYGNHSAITIDEDKIISLEEVKNRKLEKAKAKLEEAKKFYEQCQQNVKELK